MSGVTSATVTAYAAAAAAGLSAVGMLAQGAQSKATSEVQSELYARKARREQQIGKLNQTREEKKNAAVQATQRALMSGTGADTSGGSALLNQSDLSEEGKLKELPIGNNAAARVRDPQAGP